MKRWIADHKLAFAGLTFTAVYLLVLILLISPAKLVEFRTLKLNEMGDFLAGAFGPLAILWLVLGFFQQGIELRLNSDALRLQADELKNSVEQQKQMVQVSSDQHLLERERVAQELERERREAQPIFISKSPFSSFRGKKDTDLLISMRNIGAECSNVFFSFPLDDALKFEPSRFDVISPGDRTGVWLQLLSEARFTEETILMHYTDSVGVDQRIALASVSLTIHGAGDYELQVKVLPKISQVMATVVV